MAAAAVKESDARPRTISFTEENEESVQSEQPQRFQRGGRYLTLPSKAQRPEQLLREIPLHIGPGARSDRTSKLDTLMSYIRAFSNTIEYELYDSDKWREVIRSNFRELIEGLKALRHFQEPNFR